MRPPSRLRACAAVIVRLAVFFVSFWVLMSLDPAPIVRLIFRGGRGASVASLKPAPFPIAMSPAGELAAALGAHEPPNFAVPDNDLGREFKFTFEAASAPGPVTGKYKAALESESESDVAQARADRVPEGALGAAEGEGGSGEGGREAPAIAAIADQGSGA